MKIVADSRTPRRLTTTMKTMKAIAISTRKATRPGAAEVIAATPALILTATVST